MKLLDFGMAHAFGHKRASGGTPAYMAPEQWSDAPEDERTDVFALGVMLYQMLANAALPGDGGIGEEGPVRAGHPGRGFPSPRLLSHEWLDKDPVARTRDGGEALPDSAAPRRKVARTPEPDVTAPVRTRLPTEEKLPPPPPSRPAGPSRRSRPLVLAAVPLRSRSRPARRSPAAVFRRSAFGRASHPEPACGAPVSGCRRSTTSEAFSDGLGEILTNKLASSDFERTAGRLLERRAEGEGDVRQGARAHARGDAHPRGERPWEATAVTVTVPLAPHAHPVRWCPRATRRRPGRMRPCSCGSSLPGWRRCCSSSSGRRRSITLPLHRDREPTV